MHLVAPEQLRVIRGRADACAQRPPPRLNPCLGSPLAPWRQVFPGNSSLVCASLRQGMPNPPPSPSAPCRARVAEGRGPGPPLTPAAASEEDSCVRGRGGQAKGGSRAYSQPNLLASVENPPPYLAGLEWRNGGVLARRYPPRNLCRSPLAWEGGDSRRSEGSRADQELGCCRFELPRKSGRISRPWARFSHLAGAQGPRRGPQGSREAFSSASRGSAARRRALLAWGHLDSRNQTKSNFLTWA